MFTTSTPAYHCRSASGVSMTAPSRLDTVGTPVPDTGALPDADTTVVYTGGTLPGVPRAPTPYPPPAAATAAAVTAMAGSAAAASVRLARRAEAAGHRAPSGDAYTM